MAYISTARVAEIRKQLKAEFPAYKFSVRKERYSSVYVKILSGPIDLFIDATSRASGRASVNHFYIGDTYRSYPHIKDFLSRVYEIVNHGNTLHGSVYDDYGQTPDFYVTISIGDYDKPYFTTITTNGRSSLLTTSADGSVSIRNKPVVETPVVYSPVTNQEKPFVYEGMRYSREELNNIGLGASASIAILTYR